MEAKTGKIYSRPAIVYCLIFSQLYVVVVVVVAAPLTPPLPLLNFFFASAASLYYFLLLTIFAFAPLQVAKTFQCAAAVAIVPCHQPPCRTPTPTIPLWTLLYITLPLEQHKSNEVKGRQKPNPKRRPRAKDVDKATFVGHLPHCCPYPLPPAQSQFAARQKPVSHLLGFRFIG